MYQRDWIYKNTMLLFIYLSLLINFLTVRSQKFEYIYHDKANESIVDVTTVYRITDILRIEEYKEKTTSADQYYFPISRPEQIDSATEKCLNGGYTSTTSDRCICPPGFNGELCETGCGPNHFGPDCKGICSLFVSMCRDTLLCTKSYGCTCPPGLTGPLCNKDCEQGKYGANCEQTCSNCYNYICDQYTGACLEGCSSGYVVPNCIKKYPYLINPPVLLSSTYQSLEIGWNVQSDNVKGEHKKPKIKYYQTIYYPSNDFTYMAHGPILLAENNRTTEIINDLKSNTEYAISVLLISEDGNFNAENLRYGHYMTSCSQPQITDYNVKIISGVNNVTITWNEIIPKRFECVIHHYVLTLTLNQSKNRMYGVQEIVSSSNSSHFIDNLNSGCVYDVILTPKTILNGSLPSSPTYTFATLVEDGYVKINDISLTTDNRKIKLSWKLEYFQKDTTIKEPVTCLLRYKINKLLGCSLNEEHNNWTSVRIHNKTTYEILDTVPNAQYCVQIINSTENVESIQRENMAYVVTPASSPETEPILDLKHPVNSTNCSALVQWTFDLNECSKLNGFFIAFYIEIKDIDDGTLQLLETRHNFITFENLKSNTSYEVKVYVKTHFGYNRERYLLVNFTTKYEDYLKPVDDLMVYKISLRNRVAGLRWSYVDNPNLNGFMVSIDEDAAKNSSITSAIPLQKCSAWPLYYCHTFENLIPSNNYTFKIKPTSIKYPKGGEVSSVTFSSADGIPDSPANLKTSAIGQTNITLQWDIPWLLNGVLNMFAIMVDGVSYPDFSSIELPIEEELPSYNYTITGLRPGTSYSIVMFTVTKTLKHSFPSKIFFSTLNEKM